MKPVRPLSLPALSFNPELIKPAFLKRKAGFLWIGMNNKNLSVFTERL